MLDRSTFSKELIEKHPSSVAEDYSCHAYSLQVHKDPDILKHHGEIFLDLDQQGKFYSCPFFAHLYKKGLLEKITEDESRDDDIILYLDSSNHILHSGRIKTGRVVSKWGCRVKHPYTQQELIGDHVYRHHWEDVPFMYSDKGSLSAKFLRVKEGVTQQQMKMELLEFREKILPGIQKQSS